MTKITLNDLVNLQNENTAVTKINQNNNTIEQAFDNTLSRDGSTPNQMEADLDMNNHDILNVNEIVLKDGTTLTQLPTSAQEGDMIYRGSDKWKTFSIGPAGSYLGSVGGTTPVWNNAAGLGDMTKAAYDPDGLNQDAFGEGIRVSTAVKLASTSISANAKYIKTEGYRNVGDLGGALYKRVASEPSHSGKLQSLDGAWWEIKEPILNQYMFGCVGDGVADDTTSYQSFLNYSSNVSAFTGTEPNLVAAQGNHVITSTLVVMCSCDLSASTIYVAASSLSVGIRVGGNTGVSDLLYPHRVVKLPSVINTDKINTSNLTPKVYGWTGFSNSVGVQLANIMNSQIYIGCILGFGINLWTSAYSTGNVSNDIFLGAIGHGRLNLFSSPANSGGWTNENTYYGGHFFHDSGEGSNVSGVRHIAIRKGSGSFLPDNNLFIKPNIEADTPEYHVEIWGMYNRIIQGRWEASPPKVLFYNEGTDQTIHNVIDGGYNSENIVFSVYNDSNWNSLISPATHKIEGKAAALFLQSGSGDGATTPHVLGFPYTSKILEKSYTSGDYLYKLHGQGIDGKQSGDSYPRTSISYNTAQIMLGDGTATPTAGITLFGPSLAATQHFIPYTDDSYSLGSASRRWNTVYATNATINTSDVRDKDWVGNLTETELKVSKKLSKLLGTYRWKDKGDEGRLHTGVLAQEVKKAFESEGLDGFAYSLLCYDKLEDGSDKYGIRYSELLAFISAGFEQRLLELENK